MAKHGGVVEITHWGWRSCSACSNSSREEWMEKQTCQMPNSSCSASVRLGFWFRAQHAYHCVDGRINKGSAWIFALASASSLLALSYNWWNPTICGVKKVTTDKEENKGSLHVVGTRRNDRRCRTQHHVPDNCVFFFFFLTKQNLDVMILT